MEKIKATADFFTYETGPEFHYVGLSEFSLLKRENMMSGHEALNRPLLIERRTIANNAGYWGPIVLRVFRYASPTNPFGIMPGSYGNINNLMDLAAEYNCYIDWTCGDSQIVLPSVADQQADLNNFCSQIKRFCFVETCNEPFKNGELPQNGVIPPPSDMYLRDSGYYVFIGTEIWQRKYNLDFVSMHPTRINEPNRWPKWVIDIDDSISTLRTVLEKPSVIKEPAKFGVDYNDPSYAKCLGLRANMGGVVFHSQLGLESNGYDDATKVAAGEYFAGVAGSIS